MPETIQIPRAWLERLIELKNTITTSTEQNEKIRINDRVYLYGYIESAKSLLTERAKDTK